MKSEKLRNISFFLIQKSINYLVNYLEVESHNQRNFTMTNIHSDAITKKSKLYHYTKINTAKSIITSKELLLFNSLKSNDYEEEKYGANAFKSVMRDIKKTISKDEKSCIFHNDNFTIDDKIFNQIESIVYEKNYFENIPFVLSFSATDEYTAFGNYYHSYENLAMWRSYSQDCEGVAFELNRFSIDANLKEKQAILTPVIYREDIQRVFIKYIFAICHDFLLKNSELIDQMELFNIPIKNVSSRQCEEIVSFVYKIAINILKNPSFEFENEFRLLFICKSNPPDITSADYEIRNFGSIKKECISLNKILNKISTFDTISAIIFGPKTPDIDLQELVMIKNDCKIKQSINIYKSKIPYV